MNATAVTKPFVGNAAARLGNLLATLSISTGERRRSLESSVAAELASADSTSS